MELSTEQIYLVGFIASVLGAIIRFAVVQFGGKELGKFWMTMIVAAVAVVVAVLFQPPALPVFMDTFQFAGDWLALIGAYLGSATLISNVMLDKLLKEGAKTLSK